MTAAIGSRSRAAATARPAPASAVVRSQPRAVAARAGPVPCRPAATSRAAATWSAEPGTERTMNADRHAARDPYPSVPSTRANTTVNTSARPLETIAATASPATAAWADDRSGRRTGADRTAPAGRRYGCRPMLRLALLVRHRAARAPRRRVRAGRGGRAVRGPVRRRPGAVRGRRGRRRGRRRPGRRAPDERRLGLVRVERLGLVCEPGAVRAGARAGAARDALRRQRHGRARALPPATSPERAPLDSHSPRGRRRRPCSCGVVRDAF
jgi:hypothetical protein